MRERKVLIAIAGMLMASTPSYAMCARIVGNTAGYTIWGNGCGYPLIISWTDQGYCSGGCSATIGAGSRAQTTFVRGQYRWWECNLAEWNRGTCRLR